MQKLISIREQRILYVTAGVIVLAIAINFMAMPFLSDYDSVSTEIARAQYQLRGYMQLMDSKDAIESELRTYPVPYTPALMIQDRALTILTQLQDAAHSAGVKIVDMRPQAATGSKKISKNRTLVNIKTEGALGDQMKFIYEVENSLALFTIEKAVISMQTGDQGIDGAFLISQNVSGDAKKN